MGQIHIPNNVLSEEDLQKHGNILFIGDSGSGKSSSTRSVATAHGVDPFYSDEHRFDYQFNPFPPGSLASRLLDFLDSNPRWAMDYNPFPGEEDLLKKILAKTDLAVFLDMKSEDSVHAVGNRSMKIKNGFSAAGGNFSKNIDFGAAMEGWISHHHKYSKMKSDILNILKNSGTKLKQITITRGADNELDYSELNDLVNQIKTGPAM